MQRFSEVGITTRPGRGSSIGGGDQNKTSAVHAHVGGGRGNKARGSYSTIAGGGGSQTADSNAANGDWSFIGGGHHNIADGDSSIIVGGTRNTADGRGAVVVGGSENHARGAFSFIGGGGGMFADSNSAHGDFSVAVGGNHAIARGDFSFVGGGYTNQALDNYTIAVGGYQNRVEGSYSAIVGGFSNWTGEGGQYKFIGSGRDNFVDAGFSSVVGGDSNTVGGSYASIAGGRKNRVGAMGGTCIGGQEDTVLGVHSAALGGYRNRTASVAKYSVAAGKRAKADDAGCFVWADSTDADFASTDINQFLIRASGGVGIGTTSPEAPFHVQNGSAGTVTANGNSAAVFESAAATWVSILGPTSSEKGILFSDPGASIAGGIVFDHGGGGNDMAFRTGGNTTNMVLDDLGNLTVVGCVDGNNTACASDARFKRDVSDVEDALGLVEKMRGVTYKWRTAEFPDRHFESGKQYGVIAQEVAEVVPEIIREREDGYLSVEYNGLIPILLEAVKEQQRIIQKQNDRITQLEQRLEQ